MSASSTNTTSLSSNDYLKEVLTHVTMAEIYNDLVNGLIQSPSIWIDPKLRNELRASMQLARENLKNIKRIKDGSSLMPFKFTEAEKKTLAGCMAIFTDYEDSMLTNEGRFEIRTSGKGGEKMEYEG